MLPLLLAASLLNGAAAFYLPGAAPKDYKKNDPVVLDVNALRPGLRYDDAKLQSLINYDYYHEEFHFCKPADGVQKRPESLGSILFGDRIFNSPFKLDMLANVSCQALCKDVTVPPQDAKFINERIQEDYSLNWLVDGLPAAELKQDTTSGQIFYEIGFDLGREGALNNHYDIVLKYHKRGPDTFRVVGVLVWASSISREGTSSSNPGCKRGGALKLNENKDNTFYYTYSVEWEESDTPWATRWDNYLHVFDPRIHTFSLINSTVMVVFLCALVSSILVRSVNRDITRYNAVDLSEDVQEDFGWKLVHGEVFRAPKRAIPLSILVGNGAQMIVMVGVTLIFALFGFLSPSNRGSLATVMLISWTLFGTINGYVATRTYLTMSDGSERRKVVFLAAVLLPTFVFVVVFLLNLILVALDSSGAVPFGTMLIIVLLWFAINGPLVSLGAYFGTKHGPIPAPLRVNSIPRQIPPAPSYLKPIPSAFLSGILPFGAAFIEGYFLLSSIFASRAYYAFGFLALTSAVVTVATATVTILFVYFLLCAEDYRWQWRSFLAGGGSALWLLLYGVYYWVSRMSLDSLASVVLYFGYLLLVCLMNFIITGTIGFLGSYWAIRRLYSAIRID